MDTLTTREIVRAAEQGCELGTVTVHDANGEVLDGTFTRSNGEWSYSGKLPDAGKLIAVSGLVMSPRSPAAPWTRFSSTSGSGSPS